MVLFAEGTSNDGAHVKTFKSAFFGAAELPDVVVQPVTLAYRGHWGAPMTRRRRPFYAWYGDMDLVPHLKARQRLGPIDIEITIHEPTTVKAAGSRKALAEQCETLIRETVAKALAGRS